MDDNVKDVCFQLFEKYKVAQITSVFIFCPWTSHPNFFICFISCRVYLKLPHLNRLFGFAPLTASKFVFVACRDGKLFSVNVGRSQDLKCYASCCWIWSSISLHRHLVHAVLLIGMAHTHFHSPPEAFTPHPQGQASDRMCVSCRCATTLNLARLSPSAFVFLCMVGHQVYWVTYMRSCMSLSPGIIWVNDIILIFVLYFNLFKNTGINFQGGIGDLRVISVYHNEEKILIE